MTDQLWRAERPKRDWSLLPVWLALLVFAVGVFAVAVWVPVLGDGAARRLCDRAVDALLHSADLVEIERAGIIIREVPCGIVRRLER